MRKMIILPRLLPDAIAHATEKPQIEFTLRKPIASFDFARSVHLRAAFAFGHSGATSPLCDGQNVGAESLVQNLGVCT